MYTYILNLKNIRKELFISQKELARRINSSQSFISELENNLKSPSLTTIVKIANALDVSPEYLFSFKKI